MLVRLVLLVLLEVASDHLYQFEEYTRIQAGRSQQTLMQRILLKIHR